MRRRMLAVILAGGMALIATSCGQQTAEEQQTLLVEEEEVAAYSTTTAEYGDIVKNVTLVCTYTSTEEQSLSFGVEGKLIDRVEVEIGDYVNKGDLLIALDVQDLEEKIEELEFQVKKQELKLRQTEEMKQFEIDSANTLFTYTNKTDDDEDALEDKLESIEEKYKTDLEDMNDTLTLQRQRLQQYRDELNEGRLFSGITGEVTYVESGIEDTYSKLGRIVARVSNMDACYFVSDSIEYADCFTEGEIVNLVYKNGGTMVECETTPALMEKWNEQLYFKPVGDDIISINTGATIMLELDRRENVLCIPVDALHESDKGLFVYLEKDGLLEMRYVSVGLEGDELVEITDGLEPGEIIALTR